MTDQWITVPSFSGAQDSVQHFFGTRLAPVDFGLFGRCTVVSVVQAHGTDALVLDRPPRPGDRFPGAWDALVTDQVDVLLTIRTADCVPVLIHDSKRQVVAALHAGWRGAVAGLIPKIIALLQERFTCEVGSLQIGIGPSIGSCCYEVDEAVLAPLRKGFPRWRSVVWDRGRGKALLSLQGLVRGQARAAGVREDAIHLVRICTACQPRLFYSYRRDRGIEGTMISGIRLMGTSSRTCR